MERMGLVWQVEQELERIISLGLLPEDGLLPSEHTLAQRYGVSRTTVREAVLRLAAKGLVVQHPGRRSRAVALDEAVTLENLSVALHTDRRSSAERLRLLEGYLALKRETMAELLAACCEHASATDMDALEQACYALGDAVRWEPPSAWMRREFELLRHAALSVQRPGHFLLIQSLERSFWGMAARVLPHMDRGAVAQWARCAFNGVCEKNVQALRHQLPTLMQAADEHLLRKLAPARESTVTPNALHTDTQPSPESNSRPEPGGSLLPEAVCPNRSACRTASRQSETGESSLAEAVCPNRSACRTASCHAPPTGCPPPDAPLTGLGQVLGHSALGAGRLPGSPEEGGRYVGGSVPRALAPSSAAAGAGVAEAAAEDTCRSRNALRGVPERRESPAEENASSNPSASESSSVVGRPLVSTSDPPETA